MSKIWTEVLAPSQVAFMNGIIKQVPEAMGARAAFIDCLQSLVSTDVPPYRYIIAMEGDVAGTNDVDQARAYAVDECNYVVDSLTSVWFCNADPAEDSRLCEASKAAVIEVAADDEDDEA